MADIQKTINTRIVLRNDDISNWESSEKVLLKGEAALAKRADGLYELRIGDGEHVWSELSATGFGHTKFYEKETFAALSAVTDAPNGSIGIVTEIIADDKVSKTAYSFNDTSKRWEALDGNYSAENVYFKENITLAGDYDKVGNIKLSEGELSAAGKSVKTLMENIFTKELAGSVRTNPSTSNPKLYAKVNGTGSEVVAAQSYEYGTYLTNVRFAGAAFTKGTYTYGPDTAQTTCTWETQGVNIAITSGADSNSGTCESIVLGEKGVDSDNPTLSGYTTVSSVNVKTKGITVADTVEAKTNLGNTNTAAGFSKVSFAANANMSFKESAKFTGFRNMFFSSAVTRFDKTSDNIRDNSTATAAGKKTDYVMEIVEGANQVLIAVPSNLTVTKVLDVNTFGTDIFSAFNMTTVDIEGANGYTAIPYKVYEMIPDASLGANTFKVTIV